MAIKHPSKVHEESLSGLDKLALGITSRVGTMWCAFIFAVLALISAPAALTSGNLIVIISWITQTFLQLVLLPVILVGQNLQSRHSEARAELEYQAALAAEKNTEWLKRNLKIINDNLLKTRKTAVEIDTDDLRRLLHHDEN